MHAVGTHPSCRTRLQHWPTAATRNNSGPALKLGPECLIVGTVDGGGGGALGSVGNRQKQQERLFPLGRRSTVGQGVGRLPITVPPPAGLGSTALPGPGFMCRAALHERCSSVERNRLEGPHANIVMYQMRNCG